MRSREQSQQLRRVIDAHFFKDLGAVIVNGLGADIEFGSNLFR